MRVYRRSVSPTALVYCEGAHDMVFVRYLIDLYSKASKTSSKFRTKQGKGGSPDSLVVEMLNMPGSFDRRLLKLDKDRDPQEIANAQSLADRNQVVVIWSEPCLEALLLSIIEGKDYSKQRSKSCKKIFESKYVPGSKRLDTRSYEKHLPLELIESKREQLGELNQLIEFITS